MSYNSMLDKVLINLKVLSKVSEKGKISTISGSNISLENEKSYTPLLRYLNGDSRKKTVETIQDVVNSASEISNSMLQHSCMSLYERKEQPTSFETNEYNKQYQQLKNLSSEMQNCLKGLANLRVTYGNDANIVAQLEVITENAKRQIIEIESSLEYKANRGQ